MKPASVAPRSVRSPFFFTCEHASNHIPSEFTVSDEDRPWLDTHWAWDPGAAQVTRALCSYFGAGAVLAEASRLVVDVNRKVGGPGFIRSEVEGHRLSFNRDIDIVEHNRRVDRYYLPYHRTLHDRLQDRLGEGFPPLLLAVHSFTPKMGDTRREMEVAVVFDECCPDKATTFIQAFESQGIRVGINEPYSGIKGQMYSAWYHGRGSGIDYLELEMRQDFFESSARAQQMTKAVIKALEALL
jgi:predicted N-formylglutamate amidohydrolase